MNSGDKIDSILDEALSAYRDAEPLRGLEERVLQRLQVQHERQRRSWWRWSAVVACVSLLAIVGSVALRDHLQRDAASRTAVVPVPPTVPAPVATPTTEGAIHHASPRRPRTATSVLQGAVPAQQSLSAAVSASEMFPTPAPLSAEEKALVALARRHPEALSASPATLQAVAISPINIKPLSVVNGNDQGEN